MRTGCIVLDKPQGPSSHQVATWVRDIFGVEKAGHAGTLDPNVTGVLPMGLSDATKALAALKDADKAYVGVMVLHDDVQGKVLEEAFTRFTGEIYQRPPKRSAVKRELRTRRIESLELLEVDERSVLFKVDCQGGTYIRKLATDMGTYLGVGAHLAELRRTRVGHVTEDQVVNLHAVQDAWDEWTDEKRDDWLRETVVPMESFLSGLPKIIVRDSAVDAVCHGAPLAVPGVLEVTRSLEAGQTCVLETLKGEAIALARSELNALQMMMAESGVVAKAERTLMEPGVYPKGW